MLKKALPLIPAALFIIAGLCFVFGLSGHDYFGLTLMLIGALMAVYTLLIRGKKKKLLIILTVLVCIALGVFAAGLAAVLRDARTDAPDRTGAVIVLGAGLNGTAPSLSLRNRLDAAYDYLTAHPETIAVVTGGQGRGEDITEAEAMAADLERRGIDRARLIKEDRATNTEENLRFSFALLGDTEPVAVITSEYHLHRAKLLAEALGRPVYGVAAPTEMVTLRINYTIREALGAVYFAVFGLKTGS